MLPHQQTSLQFSRVDRIVLKGIVEKHIYIYIQTLFGVKILGCIGGSSTYLLGGQVMLQAVLHRIEYSGTLSGHCYRQQRIVVIVERFSDGFYLS